MLETLQQHMASNDISQTAIARAIGKSPATVNQYLKGAYKGDVNALENSLGQYIKRFEEKQTEASRGHDSFVHTRTAKRILEFLHMAHIDGEIQVLYGEAGLGKTKALREYASQHPDVIFIESDPCYTSRVILDEICQRLGINTSGNMHELTSAIVNKLRDSGRLLIIDEAELLPYRALEILRRIHDKTGIGMVLAGMPRLIINLKGKRGEFKQLYSRVGFAMNLGTVLPRTDIIELSEALIPGYGEILADVLVTESRGNGRRLSKLLRRTNRMCRLNDMEPNKNIIHEVSGMLIN
jgi:DNA transposition AAA+ family ATPase